MQQNKAMTITGWVLTIAVSGMLLMSAGMKFARPDFVVKGFTEDSGYPIGALLPIAVAELASVILFLIPRTRVLGAILVTGYMGGAIATHVRLSEPAWFQIGLGVVAWLALYLRDERIRGLLPLVSSPPPSAK